MVLGHPRLRRKRDDLGGGMPAPWRDGAGRASRLFLLVVLLAFASVAHAQVQTTFWDARRLLSSTTESTVRLLEKDREVAQVERARVQQFVDVIDRIGSHFSIAPEIVLIQGQAPNAFATRGKDGKPLVGVNLPMLDLAGTDPDLAAVVVGHEMAHLQLNHLDEGRQRAAAIGVLSVIVGAVAGYNVAKRGVNPAPVVDLALIGGALTNRKFDRDQEREADDVGITAMYRAGYDVYAAPRLWERMQQIGGGGSGWWLSTHPAHDERIEALRKTAVALNQQGPQPTVVATAATVPAATSTAPAPAAPDRTSAPTLATPQQGPTLATGVVTRTEVVQMLPPAGRTGDSAWCLAASDGTQAACSYAYWSDCNAARPNAAFRCLGRDAEELQARTATVAPPPSQPTTIGEPAAALASPAPPVSSSAPTSDGPTARRLRELLQLRKEGLITESEYNAKRQAILSEL